MSSIIPGDTLPIEPGLNITLGPGIYKDPKTQELIPTSAGVLNSRINKKGTAQLVYIDSKTKRYLPKTNDFVVGIVVGTIGEFYKISLQQDSPNVVLSMMGFPNATKKNRPNLKVGQAVYARVSQDVAEIDIEIECIDPTTGKEGGFGVLDESGYIFEVNLNFANELLFNSNTIYLEKLSEIVKFEIAIGINGKIWIKCGDGLKYNEQQEVSADSLNDMKRTIAASNYLKRCQEIEKGDVDRILKDAFRGT